MKIRMAWAALFVPFATGAGMEYESKDLFDQNGKPTQYADAFTKEQGLPKLIEGAPYRFPDREGFRRISGCVVVSYLIKPDGGTDKFVVIDSKPKGQFDETVLDSLKFWKFDSKGKELGWVVGGADFYFPPPVGSRLGVSPPVCAQPSVTHSGSYPSTPTQELTAFFPPAMAAQGEPGCAVVGFSVINGMADEYEVIDTVPEGGKDFVQASLVALNRWKFVEGADPKVRGYIAYTFKLKGKKAARECKLPKESKS